mgnify:CR=1 FL=1|tara:strand:+ start:149 stop:604 length:456 start_codon:yes stop_codon:yes gene_type:complete
MIASFLNYIFGYNKQNDPYNTNINTNKIDKVFTKLPYELKDYIFSYDGRIKYKYKMKNSIDYHKFVNVIHKHDERYNIITPIIDKKHIIMKYTAISHNNTSFYFEFAFDKQPNLMLCYDYCWSDVNEFEICYTDMKGSGHVFGSDQIRTYI